MTPREFGAQIRMRRLEKHLSRSELAEILWISTPHMELLEHGKFEERDDKLIPVLDEVFDSSPWDQLAFNGYKELFPQSNECRDAFRADVLGPSRRETPNFLVQV